MRKYGLVMLMAVATLAVAARAQQLTLPTSAPADAPPVVDTAGNAELAARFSTLAQMVLRQPVIQRPHWELAAALQQAAARLDPDNSRYARLEVQTLLHVDQFEPAREALHRYCLLEPQDTAAQAQMIDLYNHHLSSADLRLRYLRPLLTQATVAPEVRAHAAALAAEVSLDRSDPQQALGFADQALKLDPLNLDALHIKYALSSTAISAAQRVDLLLSMLRVNPANLPVVSHLADELASAGLAKSSLEMYRLGRNLANRMGQPLNHDFAMAFGEELLIVNDEQGMLEVVTTMLNADPADTGALTLRILLCREAGPVGNAPDVLKLSIQQLLMTEFNQIQKIHQELGDVTATTQDINTGGPIAWPNFQQDVAKLQGPEHQELRDRYTTILTAIAWTQIYFAQNVQDAAPALEALKELLPADSIDLARLQGWDLLLRKDPSAEVKLSAVAPRDPLSAMGLLKLAANSAAAGSPAAAKVTADAQELFCTYPSGLLGAVLWEGMRDFHIEALPRHDAERMRLSYDAFPMKAWLPILDKPQTFYVVRAQTQKVPYKFGEPIVAEISVQNISDFDIPIGDDSIFHSDLWFDAHVRDITQAADLAGCVYERLGQCLILRAHSTVTQLVRMDQALLAHALSVQPLPELQITFTVRTNPSNLPEGFTPGGYTVAFTRAAVRRAFANTASSMQHLMDTLPQNTSADKIRDMDLMNVMIGLLMSANAEDSHEVARKLYESERTLLADPSSAVRAWGSYVIISRIGGDDRAKLLTTMLSDAGWPRRTLALLIAGERTPAELDKLAQHFIDTDPDQTVRGVATALLHLSHLGPAPAANP